MFLNRAYKKLLTLKRMAALQQAFLLTAVFLCVLLIAGLSVTWLLNKEILSAMEQELDTRHQILSSQLLTQSTQNINLPDSPLYFASLKLNANQSMDPQIIGPQIIGAKFNKLFNKEGYSKIELPSHKDLDDWLVYTAPSSKGMLAIAINTDKRFEILEKVVELFFIVGLFTAITTLFTGLYIGVKNQRRFSAISNTLNKISAGDLSARIQPARNKDDLDEVALQIDVTTIRLESLLQQTKDLTSNIAHDLKTPMARLRAKLESALFEKQPEIIDDTLESALEQTDQMIATFEAILRIAHLSSGQYRERFTTLLLADIVQETADIYRAVIEDSGYQFTLKIESNYQIKGDRELLIQLIANLLENALRHTNKGSYISLLCTDQTLIVSDNGPGIAVKMRKKVLEPMYRLDASRHTKGNGLGLSLVDTIATLHGASIELTDTNSELEQMKGLKVSITF